MNVSDVSRILEYIGDQQKRTDKLVLDGRSHLLSLIFAVLPSVSALLGRDLCLLQIVIYFTSCRRDMSSAQ